MKRFFCLAFFFFSSLALFAQNLNSDRVFIAFEECIKGYLESNYIHDSAYVCYYGSKYNSKMMQYELDDGGFYYSDYSYLPDTAIYRREGKHPFFYREQSYAELLNLILPQIRNQKCKLPVLNGTIFFVHCPDECWQQFYLEDILYEDNFYLITSIDIISTSALEKLHKRDLLILKYSKGTGFKIDKLVVVRENKECK